MKLSNYINEAKGKIIAVDFDDTLFFTKGSQYTPNIPLIKWCIAQQNAGNILILWTCRDGQDLKDAIEQCEEQGLEFEYVNKNAMPFTKSPKIYADIYIDDKAKRPQEVI